MVRRADALVKDAIDDEEFSFLNTVSAMRV